MNERSAERTISFRNRKRLSGPFHPSVKLSSQLFAVGLDGRLLYAGGSWDNSLKVFNVGRGKPVASITKHLDVITCVALDDCGSYIVTGSMDCTCIVWSLSNHHAATSSAVAAPNHAPHHPIGPSQTNTNNSLTPQPINTLYGHEKPVSCVAIFTELDMVVSGSEVRTIG